MLWALIFRVAPQIAAVVFGCMGFLVAAVGVVSALDTRPVASAIAVGTGLAGLGLFLVFGSVALYQRTEGRRWRPWLGAALCAFTPAVAALAAAWIVVHLS